MRYFLDTEFNGFGGALISLALVREDGAALYIATDCPYPAVEWVRENVLPIIECDGATPHYMEARHFGAAISGFLSGDNAPVIISDWPDDIRYFCQTLITGPGQMVPVKQAAFHMLRIDAYPTTLPGAVQHNALWDARALRHALT